MMQRYPLPIVYTPKTLAKEMSKREKVAGIAETPDK
jgi:hypothetical protein